MIKKTRPKKNKFIPKLKSSRPFKRPLVLVFVFAFAVFGAVAIFYTFAGSRMSVYNDNVDYWRPRIAGCESGSGPTSQPNYQATNGTHFGAYQFDVGTWQSNVPPEVAAKYPTALTAPPEIQDQAFNTAFAKRGTQPWAASYFCWIVGANPGPVEPPPPPRGTYNVTVSGRVYVDNRPTENVEIMTCEKNPVAKTDANGYYNVTIINGNVFCLRPFRGLPPNAVVERTKNNPERVRFVSYESQLAGINAYHNLAYFTTLYFQADRNSDDGYDFFYQTSP